MTYSRVIPRDLFNEAKLLKCYGQLSLLIHEGKTSGLDLSLEHDTTVCPGFQIAMDGLRGHFYCTNLRLSVRGTTIQVGTIINSQAAYPLMYVTEDDYEGEVFNDDGSLSEEFKQYAR